MKEILKAEEVNFKDIINYPEISIQKSKTTFLTGASGSGKSALFKLFNATLSPDSGSVFYKGKNIEDIDTVILRKEVLLVSQSVYLFNGTIEENFSKFYSYRELKMPESEQMKSFLSLCCADFPLDAICDTMSGGERQRIYIAICMSLMPEVLMLDEPSSALDYTSANNLMGNIKQFCTDKGITLLIISHDSSLAEKYSDCIINLERCVEK